MVPHRRLLHKLSAYGVKPDLLCWFESFLSDRRQMVVLGEAVSNWKSVTSGVPKDRYLAHYFS